MRIAGLILACACAAAQAQGPGAQANAQAREQAMRQGDERSAEGLENILRAKNLELLRAYAGRFREAGMRLSTRNKYEPVPLPDDIEALMVRYYADPVVGGTLRALCSTATVSRSRALFDLLLAEWRSGKARPEEFTLPLCALQSEAVGVEAALLEWIVAADPPKAEHKARIIEFLGKRKYAPAVPALAALLRRGDAAGSDASHALLAIGTPDAIDAFIERLTALRREPPGSDAAAEIASLVRKLALVPPAVALPYTRLRAALPESVRELALPWLRYRKDLGAVPDVLLLLQAETTYNNAIQALVDSDSPEVWKKARAEVERLRKEGRIKVDQHRYASQLLDGKIANPEMHFSQKNWMERAKQFRERREALVKAKEQALKLRGSDPAGYVAGMRTYLAGLEEIASDQDKQPGVTGARGDIGTEYMELGHFVRFNMKRPKDALELYVAAQRNENRLGDFAVADTLQFDLREPKRALEEYRKMSVAVAAARPARTPMEANMNLWVRSWLAAQVQYLESGKTFNGTVEPGEAEGAAILVLSRGGAQPDTFNLTDLRPPRGSDGKFPPVKQADVARILQGLPASSFVLMQTLDLLASMPDSRSILAFLARHDPAGFASASYFGLVDLAAREARPDSPAAQALGLADRGAKPNPLLEAKSQFMRERRITVRPMPKQ
jgi:hypothetical protein